MTLVQLSYLVALDTYRHFRKAAAWCRVAQPSLSTQIRKLEEELGVVLFDRDKKPLVPTSIGEQIIARARIVLAEAAGIQDLVQGATGELAGELRVGILPTLAPYLVPLIVSVFYERYPTITLVFEELRVEQIPALIERDVLDVGLVATSVASRSLVEDVLFDEPLVGYVARGHRLSSQPVLTPEEVFLDDLWLPGEATCLREQIAAVVGADRRRRAVHRPVRVQGQNLETLKRLVEQAEGMAVLPALAVRGGAAVQESLVKPFAEPAPTRTIRAVFARTLLKKGLLEAFVAEVKAVVRPLLSGA